MLFRYVIFSKSMIFFYVHGKTLCDKRDREFDPRTIDARSSERKGRERGQAATRTEIDASRRKHDFPTNTRYKNSGVVPLTRCASVFFPIFRSTLRREKKREKEKERRDI